MDFEGFLVRGVKVAQLQFPEVFVGAAAARAMEHVYNTPAHRHLISVQRERFLKHFGPQAISDWNAGLSFARADTITAQWDGNEVRNSVINSWTLYRPLLGQHVVDPYNPDQRYYGVTWGQRMPLVPQLRQFAVGPGDPPHNHDPEFLRDAEEVRVLGAWRPERPTAEQPKIGLFWAYCGVRLIGTPARLYNQVIRQIVEHDGMSVPEMARALALCNVALADAGVVAWDSKYRYRVWRPVVALPRWQYNPAPGWRPFGSPRTNPVEFLLGSDTQFYLTALSFLGGGSQSVTAQSARDVLSYSQATFTPNFPSYPSGHATFGSACFNMLKRVRAEREATRANPGALDGMPEFVSDEVNGLSIDNFRNVPRPYLPTTYRHIDQMIEDNNRSRVHLGVHWDFDCKRGDKSGALIADVIYNHIYRRAAVYPTR